MSENLQQQFEQAVQLHQEGQLEAAEQKYRAVSAAIPDDWNVHYLLGTLLLQLGRTEECIRHLEPVVEQRPDVSDAQNNLGIAHKTMGHWEEAVRCFEAALKANPDYEQAWFNLGSLMADRDLSADAEKCFRKALELNEEDLESQQALGICLNVQHRWVEAEECFRAAIRISPQFIEAYVNLGFSLVQQEKLAEAVDVYRQVVEAQPDYAEVHNNLSYVHERSGQLNAALESARRTLELRPTFADGYNNLGISLRSLHRIDEACDAFRKALELQAVFPLAEFNLGSTLLLNEQYEAGWPHYERRREITLTPPPEFSQPEWNGEPIPGQRLLIHADQGFGDTLQFSRFVDRAKQLSSAFVLLDVQPELRELLAGLGGVDELVTGSSSNLTYDQHISLESLGRLFVANVNDIPNEVPYLEFENLPGQQLTNALATAAAENLKVGLVWRGNSEQTQDVVRSCTLQTLQPLFEVSHVTFVSLQIDGEHELNKFAGQSASPAIEVGSELGSFWETATVMRQLDLVITVDTASAHLAGALACPTWVMLCHTPDWRWHLNRNDSPWYPTMQLFRQPSWGDWESMVNEVARELSAFSRTHRDGV